MARLVGSVGASRDPYWGLRSTRDGLESGADTDPCGAASGVGNSQHQMALELVLCVCCGALLEGRRHASRVSSLMGSREFPLTPALLLSVCLRHKAVMAKAFPCPLCRLLPLASRVVYLAFKDTS